MSLRIWARRKAPSFDVLDGVFALFLLVVVVVGLADLVGDPEVLAIITATTAFLGLYRLRHRPNKIRPAVREDFKSVTNSEDDFGFRNFGPGSALYLQAVAKVNTEDGTEEVCEIGPHDEPLHIPEGEFVSLCHQDGESQLESAIRSCPDKALSKNAESSATLDLHYTYVSESGAREPTEVRTKQDDERVLSKLDHPDAEPRSVELWRLSKRCLEGKCENTAAKSLE